MKFVRFTYPVLLLLLFLQVPAWSQNAESSFQTLEDLLEAIAADREEDEDLSEWLEELQDLHENPLNINSAGADELLRIPFLNEILVNRLLEYRRKYGAIYSLRELAAVEGFDRLLLEKLAWFVTFGGTPETAAVRRRQPAAQQLLVRAARNYPPSAGFLSKNEKPPAFEGSPEKLYTRYQYRLSDKFQAGFTGEKDAGESFLRKSNPAGFDFWSGHVALQTPKILRQLLVGDFAARAGQGLVLWQGFTTGKSADVLQVSKNLADVRPYTSTDENRFFRGVAASLHFQRFRMHLFASSKKMDANRETAPDSSITFSSLQTSGYHRTVSEIEDERSVRHRAAGMILTFTTGQVKVGSTLFYERFAFPLQRSGQLYQKFQFSGRENLNGSVDYRWIGGKYQLFGEAAVSRSGGVALLQGAEARLHDQLSFTAQLRHFARNYHTNWGSAFAENEKAINETGFYTGIRLLPLQRVTLSAYADWYRSPWIGYTTAAPSQGADLLVQADFRLSPALSGYLRFKNENKEVKEKSDNRYLHAALHRSQVRFHFRYEPEGPFYLRSRIETVTLRRPTREQGILFYQDVGWTPPKPPLSASLRVALFFTDSYNSRIYTYENDLLYSFAVPAFFGEGLRSYLNLHYRFSTKIDGWFKIGHTRYFDRETISSGYSEIAGHSRGELKIELRYRF